jgi:hypothetical protein
MKNNGIASFRLTAALLALCALTLGHSLPATADDSKPSTAKKSPWTAEDVVNQEDASQFEVSPDGRFAETFRRNGCLPQQPAITQAETR